MWHRFNPEFQALVFESLSLASARGSTSANAADLLAAMLAQPDSNAGKILRRLRVPAELRNELGEGVAPDGRASELALELEPHAVQAFRRAIDEAIIYHQTRMGSELLLLALLRDSQIAQRLGRVGITYARVRRTWKDFERHGWDSPEPSALGWPLYAASGLYKSACKSVSFARKVLWQLSIVNPRFISYPYPAYARLRAEGLRRDPVIGFWIATRYDDVVAVLRDNRFVRDIGKFVPPERSRERLPAQVRQELCTVPEYLSNVMLLQDPPRHTRLRGLVSAAFTPSAIADMGTRIQQITDELLDRVASNGEMDLIGDFAYPLPTVVICEMLGVPAKDRDNLKRWSDEVAGLLTSTNTIAEDQRGALAMMEIREYFSGVIAELRRRPNSSLLSALVATEPGGEKLSEMELYANSILLLAAGHETTTNLIGNGMLALLKNPEQMKKLRDDPSLMSGAIEELLRYDSPVQWTARIAAEDLEFAGKSIKRGDFVLASIGSANRDAQHFADPDRLDVTRADNRHVTFGAGIHFCLGAALARMEGTIAISTLLRRFPGLHLPRQKLTYRKSRPLRGLTKLRVRW